MGQGRHFRVVQWTSGKVARESIRAIARRPNLELVGLYAHSKDKVGRDAGELAGLDEKLGVTATDDVQALIDLRPDCVVYMPLHPNVEHLTVLLRAGINVVTTASFLTGRAYGPVAREALEKAARAGNVSLFGSGINPGWVDNLAATASSLCREVSLLRITESFNIGLWAGDANQDELGWGRPEGDAGHAQDVEKATLPFGDAVEAVAEMFEFPLDDVQCRVQFAYANEDLDIPGRAVKRGTVAGIHAQWIGVAHGVPVIELNAKWVLSSDITPAWGVEMAHLIEVHGNPQVKVRVEMLPSDMTLPMEELLATGFIVTAMPVINAIPAVVGARPGIVTYADLPPITSRLQPGGEGHPPPSSPEAHAPGGHATALRAASTTAAEPPKAGPATVAGKWAVTIKGPTGAQHTELQLDLVDGELTGVQSGQGLSSPITDVRLEGNTLRWINHVTKPLKLKVEFTGVVDGDRIEGKCKAGFMGRYPFTATRA